MSMGDVMCEGGEESVLTCPHTKYPNCGHHEDAAVSCLEPGYYKMQMAYKDVTSQFIKAVLTMPNAYFSVSL